MSKGRLSFTRDDRDRRKINVAELDRLYDKRPNTDSALMSVNGKSPSGLTELNVRNKDVSQYLKFDPHPD